LTLVELLVGLAIVSLMLAAAYEGLCRGISMMKNLSSVTEPEDAARAGLDIMARDLRCAFVSPFFHNPVKSFLSTTFTGYSDRLYFFTKTGNSDFSIQEVEYFVEDSLKRRIKSVPDGNPGQGGEVEEICPEVTSMEIRYYDRRAWLRIWGLDKNTGLPQQELSKMPESVEITITLGNGDNARKIRIVAPLMCAPFSYGIL